MDAFLHAAAPLAALLINVAVQVFAFRIRPRAGLLSSVVTGFLSGTVALVGYAHGALICRSIPMSDAVAIGATNLLTYSALAYAYFHFVNLGETARRVRLVRELAEAGEHLTRDEILTRYDASEIIERRLARLVGTGQIRYNSGRLVIGKPTVLLVARLVTGLKLLLLGRRSELD